MGQNMAIWALVLITPIAAYWMVSYALMCREVLKGLLHHWRG